MLIVTYFQQIQIDEAEQEAEKDEAVILFKKQTKVTKFY